ncbi:MAG: hypothetical protein Q8N52_13390 [Acidobacteriota bacterium]|nr:hypothetical protein [Acidobacteriota bacterium]
MAGLLLVPAAAQPASAQDEGIKVHGEWVLEVRNPDGTLAMRAEFQNALTSAGRAFLPRVLAGERRVGRWGVLIAGTGDLCTSPELGWDADDSLSLNFPESSARREDCALYDNNIPKFGLTVSSVGGAIVLSGAVTIDGGGTVTHVATNYLDCSTIADGCPWGPMASGAFSRRQLPQPISVSSGQVVQVTVRISFS